MENGLPRFPQDFSCPVVLGIPLGPTQMLITRLSRSVAGLPMPFIYSCWSHIEVPQPSPHRSGASLGSSPFARHYSGNLVDFFSFRYMRCFSSRSLLPEIYVFNLGIHRYDPMRVSSFGNLRIKALLAAPRSLSQLDTSFIASRRLGIHHVLLIA